MTDQQARLQQAEREILSRRPEHSIEPSLDRIKALTALLGDPQRAYPVIHITGTNGKTSTARMIDTLLRARGLRTGLFTSPHLSSIRERISVDGEPLSAERFVDAYDEVLPYLALVDESQPAALSFFEVLTAMAFAVFADAPVDVAVIEVGVGGTWDCTNVADGAVAVVTPISIDHDRYLGNSVTAIAARQGGHHQARRGRSAGPAARRRRGGAAAAGGRGRRHRGQGGPGVRGDQPGARGRRAAARDPQPAAATTTTCSCRCSAPIRPPTPLAPSPRSRRSPGRRRAATAGTGRRAAWRWIRDLVRSAFAAMTSPAGWR